MDTKGKKFLFVGAFQDDEVNDEHPLACQLKFIGESVPITRIKTTNISKANSNKWTWDIKAVEAKSIPDDAVQLLVEKIIQLPSAARYIL
eukprot:4803818-Ditylum_brightwellii.AAC.1